MDFFQASTLCKNGVMRVSEELCGIPQCLKSYFVDGLDILEVELCLTKPIAKKNLQKLFDENKCLIGLWYGLSCHLSEGARYNHSDYTYCI